APGGRARRTFPGTQAMGIDAVGRTLITRAEHAAHAGIELGDDWHAFLGTHRLGKHGSFQELLDQQLRFRIVGDGPFVDRQVVGDGPVAQSVIGRPEIQRAIRGAMGTIDAARGAKELDGITFSYDEAGFVANRAVQAMIDKPATLANYHEAVGAAASHVMGYHAVRAGNWIHLGPEKSAPFVAHFRGDASEATVEGMSRSIKTLLHEIAHVVTPRQTNEKPYRWLSEAIAETWARWPGNIDAAAQRMGTPVKPNFHTVIDAENEKYPQQVLALRGLLQLAGIDTNSPKALAAFEDLCQTVDVSEVPLLLARRIDERFPGISRTEVKRMIDTLSPNETDADPAPVLALAERAGQRLDLPG
ncbi:MAG: hypothetical protein JWM86_1760, partial [Thermoleophilia bacterium]|nr:hypothetical protein [Thermoleophilia bacterium]